MRKTVYQIPEIRDENDKIIREGTYGKETPLANSTNDGVLDYINNNLDFLKDRIDGAIVSYPNKSSFPNKGDTAKFYIAMDTDKTYRWNGTEYVELTGRVETLSATDAKRFMEQAKASQDAAKTSETNAKTSETNASSSASKAKTSETNAKASETNAKNSEIASQNSKTASKTSETNAKTSETNAKTSETNALNSANNSKSSADKAKASETNAKTSETNALSSASSASASKTASANSATLSKAWAESTTSPDGQADSDSSTGKTQSSKLWALASKTSETNAKTSETNAKTSENNAKTSESNAKTSETNAKNSATASANSATASANSAESVKGLEKQAQASADSAANSAKAAADSAKSAAQFDQANYVKKTDAISESQLVYKNYMSDGASPLNRLLNNNNRANKLAFLPPSQVIIEKTVDGGKTWTDSGVSDDAKRNLFSGVTMGGPTIPRIDEKKSTLCGVRITFTAMIYNVPDGTAETEKYNYWSKDYVKGTERYCMLDFLWIWVNDTGDAISATVEKATGNNPNTWYKQGVTATLRGCGGQNFIYIHANTFGGGTTQSDQCWNYRITFMTAPNSGSTSLNAGSTVAQSINRIDGYGNNIWVVPNNLAGSDHLYDIDIYQNATFPKSVAAKVLKQNGKTLDDTYTANTRDGLNSLLDKAERGTAIPNANDWYLSKYATDGVERVVKRPVSALATYIRSTISDVFIIDSDGDIVLRG